MVISTPPGVSLTDTVIGELPPWVNRHPAPVDPGGHEQVFDEVAEAVGPSNSAVNQLEGRVVCGAELFHRLQRSDDRGQWGADLVPGDGGKVALEGGEALGASHLLAGGGQVEGQPECLGDPVAGS